MTFGCDFCLGLLVVIFVCDFWLELGIGMVVAGDLVWVVTFVVTFVETFDCNCWL